MALTKEKQLEKEQSLWPRKRGNKFTDQVFWKVQVADFDLHEQTRKVMQI